tara:strand:- start:25191 stop:25508 length:318 start_codon:yes stop_codon:yes gene_type:complete
VIGEISVSTDVQHPCVYKEDAFSVYVEDSPIGWLLHCTVTSWGVSTYRKLLDCLALIIQEAPRKEVYAISQNKKLSKFASLFGMESIDNFTDSEGRKGELLCLTL